MESSNSKILTVSFALAAATCGFTAHMLLKAFSAAFPIITRLADSDLVRHGFPIVVGLLVFGGLQFNRRVLTWGDEVVGEIRKVVWPNRQEVTSMTIVVCIMVLLSSAIITSFDFISGYLVKLIAGI